MCLACRVRAVERLWRGGVCEACWSALPSREARRCGRCDEALPGNPNGGFCGRCLLDPPAFERLEAAAPYVGTARRILLAFKFEGADFLAGRLAREMTGRLELPEVLEVAAVPATPRARRARRYHPASALAAAVARELSLPFAAGRLRKVRETETQSRVPAPRRAANVRRAFAVRGRAAGRVLLVDDVATSGSTARECAARLIEGGARDVIVWCFARASRADLDGELA